MRVIKIVVLCLVALTAVPVLAQEKQDDQNMQVLLEKVKADKKLLIAANMNLTESEGKAFWPIYDAYQKDLQAINDRIAKAVVAYADAYNKKALTDAQAKQLTNEVLAIDQDEVTLRKTYAGRLERALPATKAARYLQLENKIRAVIRYQLAAGIPLVE